MVPLSHGVLASMVHARFPCHPLDNARSLFGVQVVCLASAEPDCVCSRASSHATRSCIALGVVFAMVEKSICGRKREIYSWPKRDSDVAVRRFLCKYGHHASHKDQQ